MLSTFGNNDISLPSMSSAIKIPITVCRKQREMPNEFFGDISPYPKVDIVTRLKYNEPLTVSRAMRSLWNEQEKFL